MAHPGRSLVVVRTFHRPIDYQFAGLHDFAADDHLVKDLIHLVEVEDEVKLTYTSEVLVQYFDKQVDEFKHGKLVVFSVDAQSEIEAGIPTIYYLMVSILKFCNHREKVRSIYAISNFLSYL